MKQRNVNLELEVAAEKGKFLSLDQELQTLRGVSVKMRVSIDEERRRSEKLEQV